MTDSRHLPADEHTAGEPVRPQAVLMRRHLFFLPAVMLVAFSSLGPIGDNSFLWHVRAGELQLQAGEVLRSDPFSFTRFGDAWITQSWLAELGYAQLESMTGGLGWVPATVGLIGLLMLGFVGLAVYQRERSVWPVVGAVTVLGAGFIYFSVPRPVGASFAMLGVLIVILSNRERLAWALVPLLWLWALVHGTWVIAVVVIALEALRVRSARLALTGAAAAAATLLTPHGVAAWRFALDLSSNREALSYLSEWQPPDFTQPVLWPFLVVLGALLVAAVKRRIELRDLVVIVPVLFLGLMQERTVFVAVLILLPYAAGAIPRPFAAVPPDRESVGMNWVFAVAVVTILGAGFVMAEPTVSSKFPTDLVERLETDAVFHGAAVGGYLIYAEGPERLVYIDDRAELYGGAGFREFANATVGVGYRSLFEAWNIREAILEDDWPLVSDLEADGWNHVATEGRFVLMRASDG